MKRALTVNEVLKEKKTTFDFEGQWREAFGEPERTGVWFIWGNSGNGKSSFTMQLCKELSRFDRVSHHEAGFPAPLTTQNTIHQAAMGTDMNNPDTVEG